MLIVSERESYRGNRLRMRGRMRAMSGFLHSAKPNLLPRAREVPGFVYSSKLFCKFILE